MGKRTSCEGKVRHASIGGAVAHLRHLSRQGKGVGRNPYPCPHCRGWHVGRSSTGRLDSLNRAFEALKGKPNQS